MTVLPEDVRRDVRAQIPRLLPRTVSWAEALAAEVMAIGDPLCESELSVATAVGVRYPSRVRIQMVDAFPFPNDPELKAAALRLRLLGPKTTGLTLGHAILIKKGRMSRRLLSHECRHVHQYELAGSFEAFLVNYLDSILEFGAWNSPYEQDARAYEFRSHPANVPSHKIIGRDDKSPSNK